MATYKLLLLPGDGIGPEVMAEVKRVIAFLNAEGGDGFLYEEDLVGGSAYDAHGKAVSEATMRHALAADAVIFGAVGKLHHGSWRIGKLDAQFVKLQLYATQ